MSKLAEPPQMQLRPINFRDAAAITRLLEGDMELALQTAAIPIPYTVERAHEFLATADPENIFAVTAESELVGVIGLMGTKEQLEIGYWIGRKHWSRGYGTSAVTLLVEEVRRRRFSRLAAEVFPGNPASMRVFEKNGFIKVGEVVKDLPQRGGLRTLIRFECHL